MGAKLSQASFAGAFLSANLMSGNLGRGLARCRLRGANLRQICKANLSQADSRALLQANLEEADLRGAGSRTNLTGANLLCAELEGANLTGVNLTGTCLVGTYTNELAIADVSKRNEA